MADDNLRPIIVKRIKKGGGGHHGGAWKIAYADFVTAMMAFFLLMWLLGSTAKGDLQDIAEYFSTPLKVAMSGGSGSGDSSSVIQGGGRDMTRREGQVKKGTQEAPKKTYDLKAAQADIERMEGERLKALKNRIEAVMDANPNLKQFKKQLLIDITTEGLRIQIVDEQNRPMFASAKAEVQPYTRDILREIGKVLNEVPNKVSLSGHTDAHAYSTGDKGYSNWELSADRANASRRELIAGGLGEGKIVRVVGLASAVLMNKDDPFDPINRRISIIVMNKKAEENATRDGGAVNVSSGAEAGSQINGQPGASVPGQPEGAAAPAAPASSTVPAAPAASVQQGTAVRSAEAGAVRQIPAPRNAESVAAAAGEAAQSAIGKPR